MRSARAFKEKWREIRKYVALVGGILIYLPIGVPWYFGNLATYLSSYFHSMADNETDLVDPQWIFSAFIISFSLAVTASGFLVDRFGVRVTLLAAMLIHSSATFLSFFAIQHSTNLLIVVFGAMGGLGAGLAYGPPLPVIVKWMPRRVGLASGILQTGFGGGAVFYNELITLVINPYNMKPDTEGLRTTYFSQPVILDRIPRVFLILGCLTVVLQSLGVLLIRAPHEGDHIEEIELHEIKPIVKGKAAAATEQTAVTGAQGVDGTSSSSSNGAIVTSGGSGGNYQSTTNTGAILEDKSTVTSDVTTVSDPATASPETLDLSPLEILKTLNFYILWVALAFNHYGYIIKNNFYKEFGQIRISNDHFLTMIGTIATVGTSLSRLGWGLLVDYLGIKMTLIAAIAATAVSSSFWYFSLLHSAGLYLFFVVVVSSCLSSPFVLFPLAAFRLFGQSHYASNYGMILSAQIVMNLISPPIIRVILMGASWFWLFYTIAFLNAIGTVVLMFLRDTHAKSE